MEMEDTENIEEMAIGDQTLPTLHIRTPEEIEEILKLVNLKVSEIEPVVQTLYSSIPIEKQNQDFKVLELDEHLMESFNVGDCVSFRGEKKEPLVLCTASRTYDVKEAETSNTCLLIPNLKTKDEVKIEGVQGPIVEQVEIKGIYSTYLEVRECSPKLSKLLVILEPSSFKGMEYEKSIDPLTLYDWERLRSEVQASDGEILAALPEYLITEIDGYYRLISFEFEARALPFMLDLLEENSWEMDEVDKEVSCESLKEIIPKPVFDALFYKYADPSTKTKEDGTQLYKYNEAKTSRLVAQILLTASPSNDYNDFMDAWKIGSPDNIPPKEEYLYGAAIVTWNSQAMRKEIMLYPEANLPDDIQKRLNELFKVKEKWTVKEITPYIKKFATRKQDVNAILTKYARASTMNGVKFYSAKHGK